MTSDTTYNGWSNYPTWVVKLWMDNDQGSYNYWQEETARASSVYVLADMLKEQHEESAPELPANVYGDLMTWAIGMVDWHEIATALWSDYREEETEEEVTEEE